MSRRKTTVAMKILKAQIRHIGIFMVAYISITFVLILDRCDRGYAIVNVDARGSWNSEGNMYYWGDSASTL